MARDVAARQARGSRERAPRRGRAADPVHGEAAVDPLATPSPWFIRSAAHPVREGNAVTVFIDGDGYFADLARTIRLTSGREAFVELIDWDLQVDFELVPGDPDSTLAALLTAASSRGVAVRALLNLHQANPFGAGTITGYDNSPAVAFVNGLPTGAAVHDDRYLYAGTHHQKIAVVATGDALVAYSGGMDLNADRFRDGPGRRRHDVQLRIEGPAARDHHQIFVDRWAEHEASGGLPPPPAAPVPRPVGDLWAQVVRTVGNGTRRAGLLPTATGRPPAHSFAPSGDRSLAELVLHGIDHARRFIYLEDQYLVHMAVSEALLTALDRVDRLVILIPDTPAVNRQLIQGWRRRKEFLRPLLDAAPDKVSVCVGTRYYVHSKLWVFDDELAVVGSANCNRRGYTHDSEQGVGVVDPRGDDGWVRLLRTHLWAKHLRLPPEDVADPLEAGRHWRDLPPSADVAPYDPDAGTDDPPFPRGTDFFWDSVIDPDGS
jgi:phosphatidylserine/phosphatidylglycerophosphate/cardiolipin synthase-like enzyme